MNKKIIIYILLGIVIGSLVIFTVFPGMSNALRDSTSRNSVEDKCSPDPGYTEESWEEHMSHHPNIYAECLE